MRPRERARRRVRRHCARAGAGQRALPSPRTARPRLGAARRPAAATRSSAATRARAVHAIPAAAACEAALAAASARRDERDVPGLSPNVGHAPGSTAPAPASCTARSRPPTLTSELARFSRRYRRRPRGARVDFPWNLLDTFVYTPPPARSRATAAPPPPGPVTVGRTSVRFEGGLQAFAEMTKRRSRRYVGHRPVRVIANGAQMARMEN